MGLAEDRLARLKAPEGLDIHCVEPAEIALSIIAEIVERRRRDLRRDALGDLRRADQGIRVVIPSQPALRQSRCGCGDRHRSSSGTCNISAARPLPITVPSERGRLDKWLPLAGDRGFESIPLQWGGGCEPDFRRRGDAASEGLRSRLVSRALSVCRTKREAQSSVTKTGES